MPASHGNSGSARKLVVLDRDGVINHDSAAFIKSPDEWQPIPGSLEAIARLNRAGFRVVVATNQSGIGRGLFDTAMLNEIHSKMHRAAAAAGARIDAVFFCPHTNHDRCDCRKPLPGMLTQIIERFDVADAALVPMVGDALRDVQAAAAAGFQPHLVRTGKGDKTLAAGDLPDGTRIHDNLREFAFDFLARHGE
ncbi:D-glycero-beta-D-manno-heptose 1,7-bisphosphate 7-phosphatase [Robbsia sp. Bb-Pol-6]|uniref:D,D-heptose 1,7-bisphosphate phosphatase n=1 Tax=Robbsia betulipollinis TaxID=2981849 RepID=A0ABT3ZLG4_9BURK|nr:D-glycero-beta-D-manno-heptose 1,7-bisphosphate 7-phosphatase [Robbsia betulipollinis]MCY0387374.1 D-glycero-beta-D-manno-heptose 1,7-bisphosphate 7-phosphatase [Robbsia betulipollinis]